MHHGGSRGFPRFPTVSFPLTRRAGASFTSENFSGQFRPGSSCKNGRLGSKGEGMKGPGSSSWSGTTCGSQPEAPVADSLGTPSPSHAPAGRRLQPRRRSRYKPGPGWVGRHLEAKWCEAHGRGSAARQRASQSPMDVQTKPWGPC